MAYPHPILLLRLLAAAIFLSGVLPAGARGSSSIGLPRRLTASEHHARFLRRSAVRRLAEAEKNVGRVFYPIAYGADPNGGQDSSAALAGALMDAFNSQTGRMLLPGVNDLGGVVIDLQGGNYLVGQPIQFPSGVGNVVITGGTLRAADNFPNTSSLIEFQSNDNAISYEDITFRDILFDSSFRGGGLLVSNAARIRIDNCFFIHFTSTGITVAGGHETFISSTFLGQVLTVGADPHERNFTGTAIELDGNDNAITDVAIFSAAIGILLKGQANIVTGVHCYNKATGFGGVGIWVKLAGLAQTRIDNCYMDYTGILLEDPVQVHVTNAFFLGDASILLRSVNGMISGLTIVDNTFAGSGGGPIVQLDESAGPFKTVEQVVVDRNIVDRMGIKTTVARKTVAGTNGTWTADFSSLLLFPDRISHVQYSFVVAGSSFPPPHAVRRVAGNVVVVEAASPVDAVVSMEVDQYVMPGESIPWPVGVIAGNNKNIHNQWLE